MAESSLSSFADAMNERLGHGSQAGSSTGLSARRTRAETFSAYSTAFPPASPVPRTRQRGASVSMSAKELSSAFGPSLFTPLWENDGPQSSEEFTGVRELTEGTTAVARTIDYLGLDDPLSPRGDASASFPVSAETMPSTPLPLESRGALSAGATPMAALGRPRSQSVLHGLGTLSSLNEPTVFGRQRATTISYVEDFASTDSSSRVMYPMMEAECSSQSTHSSPSTSDQPTLTRSLWVGNIDPKLSPADLLSHFSPYGSIESLRVVPSSNCCFINFERVEHAVKARDAMQSQKLGEAVVKVGFGRAETVGDTQGSQPTKSLWIGNISPSTDPEQLKQIFSQFGAIESARVLTHKNCGFINFERLEDAMVARETMNGKDLLGSQVKIGYAKVPPKAEPNASMMSFLESPTDPLSAVSSFSAQRPLSAFPFEVSQSGSAFSPFPGGLPSAPARAEVGSAFERMSLSPSYSYSEVYAAVVPPLPEPNPHRRTDQARLRELRKKLEGHVQFKEVEAAFYELVDDTLDLCTDYIGNVVLQKVIEKGGDSIRLHLIERVGKHMAAIGIHKNGTWVIQKMIDSAKTPAEMQCIVNALTPYTPPLLLDQFGNYVVQCCLRFGGQRNQFIFDAIAAKIVEVGCGRFGARAIRTCMESQYTTKRQQKQVATAIIQNSPSLCTNPNGGILMTWLLDASSLPGRYRSLAPKVAPHVAAFCCHKIASAPILKLVNQRIELDAREAILNEIFFRSDSVLQTILADQGHGVSIVQKILASACISPEEKSRLCDRVRYVLSFMQEVRDNSMAYKRLFEELASVPTSYSFGSTMEQSSFAQEDVVSPLTPTAGHFPADRMRVSAALPRSATLASAEYSPMYSPFGHPASAFPTNSHHRLPTPHGSPELFHGSQAFSPFSFNEFRPAVARPLTSSTPKDLSPRSEPDVYDFSIATEAQ